MIVRRCVRMKRPQKVEDALSWHSDGEVDAI
jgi:hypothetical protein